MSSLFLNNTTDVTLDSILVRLSGGSELRGLVEVFVGTQWGYVCADHWTQAEADVVCRQLEFRGRAIPLLALIVLIL